ncbi:MAG: ABC transporter ATP-binding protein [Anaerolineae bacterium]|nr:ABC transporter ATP-binding protein [Anaerolineae bacterium]
MRPYIQYDKEQDRPKISWSLLKRVLAYARPYASKASSLVALIIISALLSLISPLLFRDLIDNALPNADATRLNWLALGLFALPAVTGLINVAQSYLTSSVGEGIISDLRQALYTHMQRMSMRFFTNTKTGEMMSRLNNDVNGAQQAVTGTLINLISNIIALVSTLAMMISMDWRLTLVGVMILPLLLLPSRRIGDILRKITREQMQLNAEMNTLMNETLNVSGALLVKIFGRKQDEIDRFAVKAVEVRDKSIRRSLVGRSFGLGLSLVGAIGTAMVYWMGGHLVLRGTFTIGTIVAFSTYLTRLYGPLTALTNARIEFATSLVSFERVFEVLDMPVEVDDAPDAVALEHCTGHVQFKNVAFSYETDYDRHIALNDVVRFGRGGGNLIVTKSGEQAGTYRSASKDADTSGDADASLDADASKDVDTSKDTGASNGSSKKRQILESIDFEMQPGKLTALVGPSGAGKTTITYLVPRLYDPTEGAVSLDGHDLRALKLASLPTHIGMVTQETYLFHDTIRTNLLYAKPTATQKELEMACRTANIHDFIAGLPEGYNTVVGERGYRLSGGEKQRIAIARVVLKNPQVLILDEATSSLDSENEALIQHALERVMKGRTSLVIAHRLSTILAADQILVIDQGQLVQRGTHTELLAQGGLYKDLYEKQFSAVKNGNR